MERACVAVGCPYHPRGRADHARRSPGTPAARASRAQADPGAITADDRFPAGGIDTDELLDQRRITRNRISEKILPDPQPESDDFSGIRKECGGLNPHVMGSQRRGANEYQRSEEPATASQRRYV